MLVGIDTYTLSSLNLDVVETLTFARDHQLDGVQFGSARSISPTLDEGKLREVHDEAKHLGLYLEVGVPTVNPHRFKSNVAVAALGAGDYESGLERLIRAARLIGAAELHSTVGLLGDRLNSSAQWVTRNDGQGRLIHEPALDGRLEPPIPWSEQLRDSAEFLKSLRPLLRDLGCRIDVETHADATTFELVRMVEEVGADIQGITLDIGNTMNQLEDPVEAARRAAPYVHGTHTKDGLLFFTERGLAWQPRACGDGSVQFETILQILARYSPDLTLSIEDHKWIYELPIYSRDFLAYHPDLPPTELAELVRLARLGQGRIDRGETPDPYQYELAPWPEQQSPRIDAARSYLKGLLARLPSAA